MPTHKSRNHLHQPPALSFVRSLIELHTAMWSRRICALGLPWRVFGQGQHRCQPSGALLRRFVRRARTRHEASEEEMRAAEREAAYFKLNTPYGGKPLYLYLEPTAPQCGTHSCTGCPAGFDNCALPTKRGQSCELRHNVSDALAWINHYAFQSAHHWELKKLRGRTNQLPPRRGDVPGTYDRVHDTAGLHLLDWRLQMLPEGPLRRCLASLFGFSYI